MVNKVILVGNLGRDPEIRSTPTGQAVATFSLATSRRWRDKNGQKQDHTEWHNVVCWGKQAEVAGQYLQKGKQVYVEGRLQTRSWEDRQTGEKKYRTEVICQDLKFLGGASGSKAESDGEERTSAGPAAASADGYDAWGEDDDIPFGWLLPLLLFGSSLLISGGIWA